MRTKTYTDDEGRVCVVCNAYKDWKYYGKNVNGHRGKQEKCKDCIKVKRRIYKLRQKRRYIADQLSTKRWSLVYDPTNTFGGDFGNSEFQATLDVANWPEKSVWRDRINEEYYFIENIVVQKRRKLKNHQKFIEEMKENLPFEKPPLGERKVYR